MKKGNVIVIAPHPDDETLGCGGTLLMFKENGYSINWIIITSIFEEQGFLPEKISLRNKEIEKVCECYGFDEVINMQIPTTKVDEISIGTLISNISEIFNKIKPNIILTPFIKDVHTDHRITTEAVISCTKWFRYPFIEKILYYETISETDFNIDPTAEKFLPNVYVDIYKYIDRKIEIMNIYKSEIDEFPFPRSKKAIRSLAYLRGSQSGFEAAEAFQLLRANIKCSYDI